MAYHRSYSFIGTFATIVVSLTNMIEDSIRAIADFARACLQVDHGVAWQSLREFSLVAFRKIADLKPEYRASYRSHGLDFGRLSCPG